jgi:excisionase family DNA binding protein
MAASTLTTLDPTDPDVRAEARRLSLRLADDPSESSVISRAMRSMLDDIAQGERLIVLHEDEDLTPGQAARIIGVTRQYVDRLLSSGVLAYRRIPGSKHRRIRVGDVVALAAERQRRKAGHTALLDALTDAGLLDNA